MVGPPASGKTTRLIERAREAALAGRRVWWVGLPSQRSYVYRRATRAAGVLGLEFLTAQQVAYRLLADALRLRPLVVGTARLVLVGEALFATERAIPAAGEAQLFAYAIAEAKRYRLGPRDVPVHDRATERLRAVFEAYERLKGDRWDYDDFRAAALAIAKEGAGSIEADLVVVDGFREVGPVDLELYRRLGDRIDVVLALPDTPPGETADTVLDEPDTSSGRLEAGTAGGHPESPRAPRVACYRAKNPVAEARWVLRSVKRDLAGGMDPLDVAVIMPGDRTRAFAALADEYGVPVMDETPGSLAATPAGHRLTDLLALPDAPTSARLLVVADLEPLGRAVLAQGVAGAEAVGLLAEEIGLGDMWREWRTRLAPERSSEARPEGPDLAPVHAGPADGMDWARWMVDLASAAEPDLARAATFREQALRRAKEASVLASGLYFRQWWAALLQEAELYEHPPGGVALLDATRASGRRFARTYLIGAVAGAYDPGVGEDWFVPEEGRVPWHDVFLNPGGRRLPHRFRGASRAYFRELLSRGNDVIVTYPAADRDGPREPDPELVTEPKDLPDVPAGSRLELVDHEAYRAPRRPVSLAGASVERLRRYAECGFRTWAEDLTGATPTDTSVPAAAWWRAFREDLLREPKLEQERIEELRYTHPEADAWLAAHADTLRVLTFGVRLDGPDDRADEGGPWAHIDAARRDGGTAVLYRFAAPGSAESAAQAEAEITGRWSEMWAAGRLLTGYGGRIERVDIRLWPILGTEIDVFEGGITYPWRRVKRAMEGVEEAYERFAAGDIEPRPGFICRSCVVADVCREGLR